ncbi:VCBS repeat-containing protein [Flagellimonas sp. HMM57]|uniref:FG-GAP repeat domain-containing protein n=1 Tax=unclassified Flagellimonas TaxID=2644544 RepID=UPI0013D3D447|nr:MULTISPECIES: VCBS repeat-containing protein [unclassified Flagellimonas]UII76463.1 VCBS repeat-containing protein [Flagellimonas sp. HMM57]
MIPLKFITRLKSFLHITFIWLFALVLSCCKTEEHEKEIAVYNKHCASCHVAPKINELPKDIWKNAILPDMFSRMEVENINQKEYKGPFISETTDFKPRISINDVLLLEQFILNNAPDKLEMNEIPKMEQLDDFEQIPIALDNQNGALITYLDYNHDVSKLYFGTVSGTLNTYDFRSKEINNVFQGETPVTWFNQRDTISYVTEIGLFDPSELERGAISKIGKRNTQKILENFHRPVHTVVQDLNGDGKDELVISEFGNETGKLSMLVERDTSRFEKTVLLNQSGCIRTIAKDMNHDDKLDLVVLTSQGREGITILYQKEGLRFEAENVLKFSPVYGSSWFELVDYNNDGYIDIITVNGDNADKSYVQKPYHGMRIHLNDGNGNYEEAYFYPLNGATRVAAADFDEDGDIDFGLISSFPDYERAPQASFVYLENINSKKFEFKTKILKDPDAGRWFLMDAEDIDNDGDKDIILSSLTYTFSPTPEDLLKHWSENNVDLMVLKNELK